jgi:hypothetical protein
MRYMYLTPTAKIEAIKLLERGASQPCLNGSGQP